ncbi:hypothetical protein PInf_021806 [Phytophthora infestans]|nr:hypothetical protein PInf_021806 [Phytophthora infestans]
MLPGKATAHWSVVPITTLQQAKQREYVSQQPLSQSETICTNITFGLPFDADKYEDACARTLTVGGRTEIGVKGLNFSSCQRTRVVIARAVYQAVNIYLLEAVLSAVDSHVGTNIFKACFKKSLKGKLVLLVAHSLSFVSHCDQIVVIADGRIT